MLLLKQQIIPNSELLTKSERTRIKRIILREWTACGVCIEHLNFYSIDGKSFEIDMEDCKSHHHSPSIDFGDQRGVEELKTEHARRYQKELEEMRESEKLLSVKHVKPINLKENGTCI